MSEEIRIQRTGKRPLVFEGALIAKVSGLRESETRWHTIGLYRSAGGQYVVHIRYETEREEETAQSHAEALADGASCAAFLEGYDPLRGVRGFPDRRNYRARQVRLEQDVRERYALLVTQIMDHLPDAAERVR